MTKRARAILVSLLVLATIGAGSAWLACRPVRRPDGGVGLVEQRSRAPDFSAKDQDGQVHTLAALRGKPVVLFFYPRDGTPGCTKEACAFRDAWKSLSDAGAIVLGVSTDDVASHAEFAKEHGLQFPLLADPDGLVTKTYGVGTTFGMASRVTFVIDREGFVAKVFPDVDPAIHATEVIATLKSLP